MAKMCVCSVEVTASQVSSYIRDTLQCTMASQTADSGRSDSLDVITEDFRVKHGASFPEFFTSFASASLLLWLVTLFNILLLHLAYFQVNAFNVG